MGRDTNGMTSSVSPAKLRLWAQVLSRSSASPCDGPQMPISKMYAYQVFKTYTKGKEYDRKCPRPELGGRAPGSVLPATNWKLPRPGIALHFRCLIQDFKVFSDP